MKKALNISPLPVADHYPEAAFRPDRLELLHAWADRAGLELLYRAAGGTERRRHIALCDLPGHGRSWHAADAPGMARALALEWLRGEEAALAWHRLWRTAREIAEGAARKRTARTA